MDRIRFSFARNIVAYSARDDENYEIGLGAHVFRARFDESRVDASLLGPLNKSFSDVLVVYTSTQSTVAAAYTDIVERPFRRGVQKRLDVRAFLMETGGGGLRPARALGSRLAAAEAVEEGAAHARSSLEQHAKSLVDPAILDPLSGTFIMLEQRARRLAGTYDRFLDLFS